MKKTVVTLSLLTLALTGCTSGTEQSGGSSNPDSQVEQPPLPGGTEPRPQGVDPSADDTPDDTPDDGSEGADQDTDQESDGDDDDSDVGATPGATG